MSEISWLLTPRILNSIDIWSEKSTMSLLALPKGKGMHIGVGFEYKILAWTYQMCEWYVENYVCIQ
jgi:hypothetical protein